MKFEGLRRDLMFGVYNTLFNLFQKLGVHLTPVRYYSPIPDTRSLKDELWIQRSNMTGVRLDGDKQMTLLRDFSREYKGEYSQLPFHPTNVPHEHYLAYRRFGSCDGEVLYCMIRKFKPARIIEIGSGNTTYLMAQALLRNREETGRDFQLTAFDPYPNNVVQAGFPGLSKCIKAGVEDVPLSAFAELDANDVLFIDSSHALRIGGDVQYEYREIIPSLRTGVLVHSHDIYLPAEYPKKLVMERKIFWGEQYLLQAFLAFNDSFSVEWAGSYMHLKHPEELEAAFPSYVRDYCWPSSFWMRRVA
jgi:predicted O-methyltransferase YrrM